MSVNVRALDIGCIKYQYKNILGEKMIRICDKTDLNDIYQIITDSAKAYKGVIPDDRYHEPYMIVEELKKEINDGVVFGGMEQNNELH